VTYAEDLAVIEARIGATDDPDLLVALAADAEQIGARLARALSQATDPARALPLKPLMMHVPVVAGGALLRAAERYDDRGQSRRAAVVLFRALHAAIDRDLVRALATALAFVLDAHGLAPDASQLGALVTELELQRAAKVPLREARANFHAALDTMTRNLDWDVLPDGDENLD
jgi:hypothetical protein